MSNDATEKRNRLVKALPEYDYEFYTSARERLFYRVFDALYSEELSSGVPNHYGVVELVSIAVEHSQIAAMALTLAARKEDLHREGTSSRNGAGDGEMCELEKDT